MGAVWAPRPVSLSQIKHCRQCFRQRQPLTQPHKSHLHLALSLSLSLHPLTRQALVQAVPNPRKAPSVQAGPRVLLPSGTWARTALCHRDVSPVHAAAAPDFVTAAVSQDMATVPARKGTFYPAETGQQFKWGNVITHTSVWPSDGIGCLRGEHPPCLLEAVQTLEMNSHMSRDALTTPGRKS